MNLEITPGDLKDRKADSKGRVAIGPEYADKQVVVAVIDAEENDE